jgi:hypothetical protein
MISLKKKEILKTMKSENKYTCSFEYDVKMLEATNSRQLIFDQKVVREKKTAINDSI